MPDVLESKLSDEAKGSIHDFQVSAIRAAGNLLGKDPVDIIKEVLKEKAFYLRDVKDLSKKDAMQVLEHLRRVSNARDADISGRVSNLEARMVEIRERVESLESRLLRKFGGNV